MQSNAQLSAQAKACRERSVEFFAGISQLLQPFVSAKRHSLLQASQPAARGRGRGRAKKKSRTEAVEETVLSSQPRCIVGGEMRSYQLEGLSWLVTMHDRGVNALLGDEMGLGKTLQTISLLGYLHTQRNEKGPHLVVVPLSVLSSWCTELRKWCPMMRVVKLHSSSSKERDRMQLGHARIEKGSKSFPEPPSPVRTKECAIRNCVLQ